MRACPCCSPHHSSVTQRAYTAHAGSVRRRQLGGADYPNGGVIGYDPCIDGKVYDYLNRMDVQQAIHANTTLPWYWSMCSNHLDYSEFDFLTSMIPLYPQLMEYNISMLIYSGDVDTVCSATGTFAWIANVSWPIKTPMRPWTYNGQVGGRVVEYEGITVTTIRNAGHMVCALTAVSWTNCITRSLVSTNRSPTHSQIGRFTC